VLSCLRKESCFATTCIAPQRKKKKKPESDEEEEEEEHAGGPGEKEEEIKSPCKYLVQEGAGGGEGSLIH
jgi:hypothetical protein